MPAKPTKRPLRLGQLCLYLPDSLHRRGVAIRARFLRVAECGVFGLEAVDFVRRTRPYVLLKSVVTASLYGPFQRS